MTIKQYKDGQKIGSATNCIHCSRELHHTDNSDSCQDIEACTERMRPSIELEEGAKF